MNLGNNDRDPEVLARNLERIAEANAAKRGIATAFVPEPNCVESRSEKSLTRARARSTTRCARSRSATARPMVEVHDALAGAARHGLPLVGPRPPDVVRAGAARGAPLRDSARSWLPTRPGAARPRPSRSGRGSGGPCCSNRRPGRTRCSSSGPRRCGAARGSRRRRAAGAPRGRGDRPCRGSAPGSCRRRRCGAGCGGCRSGCRPTAPRTRSRSGACRQPAPASASGCTTRLHAPPDST